VKCSVGGRNDLLGRRLAEVVGLRDRLDQLPEAVPRRLGVAGVAPLLGEGGKMGCIAADEVVLAVSPIRQDIVLLDTSLQLSDEPSWG